MGKQVLATLILSLCVASCAPVPTTIPTPVSPSVQTLVSQSTPVVLQEAAQLEHTFTVGALAFSPDGRQLATADWRGGICVWDTATWHKNLEMIHGEEGEEKEAVETLAFSPDGHWLATGSFDDTTRLWDVTSGRQVAEIAHEGWVYDVAFSSDGKWLVTGSLDGTVGILDVSAAQEIGRLKHELMVHDLALSPDGRWLATMTTGSWGPGAVQVWDLSTQQSRSLAEFGGNAYSNVVFSPDGCYLAAGLGGSGPVAIWETSTWHEVTRLATVGTPQILVFSPDGQQLAGVGSGFKETSVIWIWDASTWREVARRETEDVAWDVALSPDGQLLAIGLGQGVEHEPVYEAQLWETTGGTLVARMSHEGQVLAVAFSHDGHWLATGSSDRTVRIWDLRPVHPV